jgi:prepilin-type N-terminal cleavage/methylation domain-containing protein
MRRADRGFSLMEVMVALTVLLIALTGAVGGLLSASQNITEGQMRQYKASLAEVHIQKYMLLRRDQLGVSVMPTCTGACGNLDQDAIGSTRWVVDGAWQIPPATGIITAKTAPATDCSAIAIGWYCREVALTNRMPDGTDPAQGKAFTVWARVVKGGEPKSAALVHREVFVQ